MMPLLTIQNLSIRLQDKMLLEDLSLTLHSQQCLAIVGESGSGKSLLSRAICGLLPEQFEVQGALHFQQQSVVQGQLTQGVGLIVQQSLTAFNPLLKLEKQFLQTLQHSQLSPYRALSLKALREKMLHYLAQVKLPAELLQRYPHQLSGGQLQRLMLAITLALEPKLIIADEPTSALDASTQFELLPLFKQLAQKQGCALIFITHDLGIVREIADQMLVLKAGQAVEFGEKNAIFNQPQQSYTQYLLAMREKLNAPYRALVGSFNKGI